MNLEETNIFTQKGFLEFYKSKQFSDVVIVLMSGKEYFCHKLLLANCSEYFYKLFIRNQMKGKKFAKQMKNNESSQFTVIEQCQASDNLPTSESAINKHSETLTTINEDKTYVSPNSNKSIPYKTQWKKANISSNRQNQTIESSLKPTQPSVSLISNLPQQKDPFEITTTSTIYETNSITTQKLQKQMNPSNQRQEQTNRDNRRNETVRGNLPSQFIYLFIHLFIRSFIQILYLWTTLLINESLYF